MKTPVEQGLGKIHRIDMQRFRFVFQRQDEFVACPPLGKRCFEAGVLEARHQVICIQRREFPNAFHAVLADHAHVHISAQQNAGVAHETGQPADTLRQIIFREPVIHNGAVLFDLVDDGHRQVRQQTLSHSHGAGTGSAAAVRRGECLVQVEMNDVEAHVTGANLAEDGVQVCAVVVEQAAGLTDYIFDLQDPALEYAQRRRIGQHDAGRVRSDRILERRDIDIAVFIGRNLLDDATAHRRRCGIRAMRRVRHDDLVAIVVPARQMIGANHGDTRKFSLSAGHRR